MFLLGQQSKPSSIIPPGSIPTTCASNCNLLPPEIGDSAGNIINIGDYWDEQGGYYSGLFTLTGNEVYALIISPANIGQINNVHHSTGGFTSAIRTYMQSSINGKKNTDDAINYITANNLLASYPLFANVKQKRDQNVGGFNDWYIPSQQEYLLMYKYFKPDTLCTITTNQLNCTGQQLTSLNLIPCNSCDLSNVQQTTYSTFIEKQSESFKPFNNIEWNQSLFYTSSNNFPTGHAGFIMMTFKYGTLNGYQNYISTGYPYDGSFYPVSRLVRRVLVS